MNGNPSKWAYYPFKSVQCIIRLKEVGRSYMQQESELKKLGLKGLIENRVLYSKVYTMMSEKRSYSSIIRFLRNKGYSISKGTLTNLKRKIEESQESGIPLVEIVDGRTVESKRAKEYREDEEEKSIDDLGDQVTGYTGSEVVAPEGEVSPVYSSQQLLEQMLSKSMASIVETDYYDEKTILKVIDLYEKYYGTRSRGLTSEALKQYQILMNARDTAYSEVFMKYVPKDKQKEAIRALEQSTREIINQVGVTKQGKELLKQLDRAGLEIN